MTNRSSHISPPFLQDVDPHPGAETQADPKEGRSAKHVVSDMAVEAEDALENPPPTEKDKEIGQPNAMGPWIRSQRKNKIKATSDRNVKSQESVRILKKLIP